MSFKHAKDKFLVLVTDGISFVMTDDEIVDCVANANTPTEATEKLIDQALLYASEDNVTAIVLPLGEWKAGVASKTNVFYSLGRSMALTSRFS
jgi:serine/threonine protein phosphatase PrpC